MADVKNTKINPESTGTFFLLWTWAKYNGIAMFCKQTNKYNEVSMHWYRQIKKQDKPFSL